MKAYQNIVHVQTFRLFGAFCRKSISHALMLFLVCFLYPSPSSAKNVVVDSLISVVDGTQAPFNQLVPGDTILLKSGTRQSLLLRNLYGSAVKPLIITNSGGVVVFDTDGYYGISARNSRYFRLTGQGSVSNFYGIHVARVANGAGIGINDLCSDFEIDHVFIENTLLGGLYAKTDPDCETPSTRDNFTQYNTNIHDNRIANVGNEGMYIGSTKYFGIETNCNGKDTLLLPSLLDGVHIYNNIIESTAWDGIQVSSASKDCQIWGNIVLNDSQEGYFSQMSGIMIGGGSKCDCYNNYIGQGKGNGIESHGLGGYRIFNNIIVDAGRSYLPLDSTERKHGIYVSDISMEADASVKILFNDIIRPKSDGIRFQSTLSKGNVIASNLIVDPGSFEYYEHGNTSFKGEDSYIMIPDPEATDVSILTNFMTRSLTGAGISSTDFKPLEHSPLIDAADSNLWNVTFDYLNKARPNGLKADIGAYEFVHDQPTNDTTDQKNDLIAYPNPASSNLNIRFETSLPSEVSLIVYDLAGNKLTERNKHFEIDTACEISIPVHLYPSGIYLFSLQASGKIKSGKFIKIN